MMLMLTSMVDHQAIFQWSHVGFVELAKWTRDCSRRMETMVALLRHGEKLVYESFVCQERGEQSHIAPVMNITAALNLLLH